MLQHYQPDVRELRHGSDTSSSQHSVPVLLLLLLLFFLVCVFWKKLVSISFKHKFHFPLTHGIYKICWDLYNVHLFSDKHWSKKLHKSY